MKRFAVVSMAVVMACLVGADRQALAQERQPPLAEVARKEAERRKAIRSASPVYTNADVKESGRPASPAPPPAAAGEAGAAVQPPAPASEPGAEAKAPPSQAAPSAQAAQPAAPAAGSGEAAPGDEAFWRRRMAEARERLHRSKLFAEALQSRINALWADFTARDDPAQRALIEANRQEALAELERVKADIERETRAIEELEEEARKAGVPPGWLR
jgi:hypothetical protein